VRVVDGAGQPIDAWYWERSFDVNLDFCVWTLEVDGLQVAPFVQHRYGHGLLRAAGMGETEWRRWFRRVFSANEARERLTGMERGRNLAATLAPKLSEGGGEVGEALANLWDQYARVMGERKRWERMLPNVRIWEELIPFRDTVPPPLRILLVGYLAPVELLLPPSSALVGFTQDWLQAEAYRSGITGLAAGLTEEVENPG